MSEHARDRWRAVAAFGRGDLIGLFVIVVVVFLYLSPALKDGGSFGPTDLGQGLSALTRPAAQAPVHDVVNGDIITQDVAWNTLDWKLVHAGEFPLWNDLSGTGLPQFLNSESAPLALPTLVSYLFPLSLAFLVTIALKLLIAGFGTYLACRVLGTGRAAATFGGVSFMLSGSFSAWLGWAVSGPVAWIGFIVAGLVLTYRTRSIGAVALLAVSVMFAIYGGFPETDALMAAGLVLLVGVVAIVKLACKEAISWRGVGSSALGVGTGVALSAPLWLPSVAVLSHSARAGKTPGGGLPIHAALLLFSQGYYGLPLQPPKNPAFGSWFGLTTTNYFESAAYVGIVALVLGAVALVISWRRPIVVGLALGSLGCVLVVYQLGSGAPIQHLLRDIDHGAVSLQRMLTVLAFFLAVLAALGFELLLRRWRDASVLRVFAVATAAMLLIVVVLWVRSGDGLPGIDAAVRRRSLYWPSATVVVLGAVGIVLYRIRHRADLEGRARLPLAGLLVACQGSFLLFAGVGINSYAHAAYPRTEAVDQLQAIIGSSLLGLDGGNTTCVGAPTVYCGFRSQSAVGFYPEENLGYGIAELGMHDPVIPKSYLSAWPIPNAGQNFKGNLNYFLPAITSATLARRYGVEYVLVAPGVAAPTGTTLRANIAVPSGTLMLYEVPRSGRFSFNGSSVAQTSSSHPNDAEYIVALHAKRSGELIARITDVSGWHATADGHPLSVSTVDHSFLAVHVPAGTEEVTFTYWPSDFDLAIGLALLAVVSLLGAVLLGVRRRFGQRSIGSAVAGRGVSH